ncbi:MAG: adenylate synthase [Bacteroidetes bacterium]|nr:adenylate synthase [Bacteroidota bacterium]
MRFKLKIIYYWLQIQFAPKLRSREAIEAFQVKKMNRFAFKTLIKSKFYQPYFIGNKFNWTTVPQISKTEFMAEFNQINTLGIDLNEAMKVAIDSEKLRNFKNDLNGVTVGLSTGTSGKRGLFLVSENEKANWVALVISRVIKPRLFRKQKIAFFLRANSNLYSSVESSLFEFKYFDIFKPIQELLESLNHYQPNILASQPSILMDIALAQKNRTIHISPIQIISFAEVLHKSDKDIISSIFNTKITEAYQCTEGFLGASCKHGTMHLNEDFIRVDKEWIDENKFYPIITDFSRSSQPVVKYKLNDVLEIKNEACPCGSKLLAIEKIIGRDDDILIFDGIKVYPDLIARKIALHTDSFQLYTIEQTGSKELHINIACNEADFENNTTLFKNALNDLFKDFGITEIDYHFDNNIASIKGNKTRKIKRLSYEN